tara:strand:- start:948 stop:1232 length:285 start_codon:yes stop_codon:yes gene_type:complete
MSELKSMFNGCVLMSNSAINDQSIMNVLQSEYDNNFESKSTVETNNNHRSIFDQDEYYSKQDDARIEYSTVYNHSKGCYFRGVTYPDGSYADLD